MQVNPQTYFSNSVGLKAAMTGYWGVWSDTLWINGYAGGDVLQMVAIHTKRDGNPKMGISAQASNGTTYGGVQELISSWSDYQTKAGVFQSNSSLRAPVFYDSNNTNYYVDPGATSVLNNVIFSGGSSTPVITKYSNKKSWVQHITTDAYIFAPSTATNGTSWDWANGVRFTAAGAVQAKNFIGSSDIRLKTNIKEVGITPINVNWNSYEMKSEKGQLRYGTVAQDLEKRHPEFVRTDEKGWKSVAYIDLLVAKVAELEARLKENGI